MKVQDEVGCVQISFHQSIGHLITGTLNHSFQFITPMEVFLRENDVSVGESILKCIACQYPAWRRMSLRTKTETHASVVLRDPMFLESSGTPQVGPACRCTRLLTL